MKSAVITSNKCISIQELPIPTPGPGEVVVQIKSALTSSVDVRLRDEANSFPAAMGREYAGVVYRVGPNVTSFQPGESVMVASTAGCGQCLACQREQENFCDDSEAHSSAVGFAEYALVNSSVVESRMHKITGDISYTYAAFLDPLAAVLHGLARVPVAEDDIIVILGGGSIGLMFLQTLKALFKYKRIVLCERDAKRLQLARQLGAEVVDTSSPNGFEAANEVIGSYGAQLIIECAGTPMAWNSMLSMASRGSNILVFGGCQGGVPITVDTARLHYDQISILGTCGYVSRDVAQAAQLLNQKRLELMPLITASRSLDSIAEVFESLRQGAGIKYELVP